MSLDNLTIMSDGHPPIFPMTLLNLATLRELEDLLPADSLVDFLEQARQDMVDSVPVMQQQFAAGDWQALKQMAHRLKGTLGSLGCDAVFASLSSLEADLRAEPPRLPGATTLEDLAMVIDATSRRLADRVAGRP